ncbi:MAG: nucleoside recognition protein [Clostridia bacterium]|nr:nucleoside recognition protein [Clostridia bacterium]
MSYLVPVILLSSFVLALVKRVSFYDSLTEGIKDALLLTLKLCPNLVAVFMAISLMQASGLSSMLANLVSPIFLYLGIPKELLELIILRPLSGSGSLALLESIYATYGVDSYLSVSASIIMGSTETIFYVVGVYFQGERDKKTGLAIPITLFASFIGVIVACAIARIIV